MAHKKLYRSNTNRVFAGVCGGIAEYIDVDPTLIRVFYMALSIFSAAFPGLLLYILLVLIIPLRPFGGRNDGFDDAEVMN
ncbi:MAG: PspC domain-containing protein [Paludibacteraceae bacterium]|nr:PspC domain-containing protein [Paludibacteraceae bacterium]